MRLLKALLLSFSCSLICNAHAQILLRGYKCLYDEDQPPNLYANMYCATDTFGFTLYSRDIMGENENDDPKKGLKIGLRLCFQGKHYFKTKDSLYIYTGKYYDTNIYVYKIYIPEKQVALSVRSRNNDQVFSDRSKWLLSQIRLHRPKDMYLINEKGQTCQNRDEDDLVK
jgi:hypothetical protein